jgi:hypothetical protein
MDISFAKEPSKQQDQTLLLRLFYSLALGTFAIAVGAVLWGLIGYFSGRVFFIIAVLLGIANGAFILQPLHPVRRNLAPVFLVTAALATLLSLFLGELLYISLGLMRDYQATFHDALTAAVYSLGEIVSSSDTILSGVFGLLGSAIGFRAVWKKL